MQAPIISTRSLTKRYGSARGIEDITMDVRRGEVFGLLGPNGAGKTTLIRTLLDLLHPTAGTAQLFGLDSRRDSVAIRERLGDLPGDFACDPHMTGRELVAFCAAVRGVDGLGRAPELAARFKADLDRPVGDLSRGNRQKIGLVQALFHEPELVVLDEPTSGLDPLMQEQFLQLVEEQRARGVTVLLSSHALDEVERVCDRVAIIREGRLAAVEEVAQLRGHSFHHVHVTFAAPVDPAPLAALDGVGDLRADGPAVHLRFTGDMDALVKLLAAHPVADLQVTEPTLEEIFVAFYEHDDGRAQ